jgi:hypothetical protein
MDTIFVSVRNGPDMRESAGAVVIDHYAIGKGVPCSRGKLSGCVVPDIGAFYKSNGPLPYIPSYTKIGEKSIALEPAVLDKQGHELKPDTAHEIEIISGTIVLIDGFFVAEAPRAHASGKKYTAPEKLKFCKAVVWQLLSDEGTLLDALAAIGTIHMPVDICERVQVMMPAPVDPIAASEPVTVVLPDTISAYTPEAITGYPATKDTRGYELSRVEMVDLMEMNHDDMGSEYDSLSLENEFNKGEEKEMYEIYNPAIVQNPANVIRSWSLPHVRCMITEEVCA